MRHDFALITALLLLPALPLASGCGMNMAPVLDIQRSPVTLPGGYAPSPARTRDAILRGLVSKGWAVDREEGQSIVASINVRGHSATVGIDYDASSFSIHYVTSSEGLKYDGVEIHRRYNHWVDRLRASINQAIAESSAQEPAGPAPAPPPDSTPVAPAEPATPAPAPSADPTLPPPA